MTKAKLNKVVKTKCHICGMKVIINITLESGSFELEPLGAKVKTDSRPCLIGPDVVFRQFGWFYCPKHAIEAKL